MAKEQGKSQYTNRLIREKSPYLLQHAYNPVDWYPWGAEAFEKAKKENKPIFLSIGYSSCHWCHVMERESFEDPEVAQLLNEVFVCIKVDREERPDIDHTYMTVCQMMTGSGGWPLNIMMTPDQKPFFAATYIPKESRFGRVGLKELCWRIKNLWATRQEEIEQVTAAVIEALGKLAGGVSGEELGLAEFKEAYLQLAARYDPEHGGFGSAPKFPTPHNFLFLLRYWKRTGDAKALEMVEKTLQAMRQGGIYDHLGFGFHRYSTDPEWLVPHFEKMLYDQAMLGMAYLETYQATSKEEYAQTAREIFTYVLRDMTAPSGGFYSAEDADSEGEEGKFYLWTMEEIKGALSKEEAEWVIRAYQVEEAGNFENEATGRRTGANILHLKRSLSELATELKMPESALRERLEAARQKLFALREKRVHPYKDDKILTDWNGLMIAALAKGAQVLDEPRYAQAAQKAAEFLLKQMRTPAGRLLHRYWDGQAAIPAYLDDYAFLIWGLIELYEVTFKVRYLQTALELNQELIRHFWDEQEGGFYFTADDAEQLLVRQKEIYDGACPAGNSVAMENLLRLGRMTANPDLEAKAVRLSKAFSRTVKEMPMAHTQLMAALDFALGPSYEVVIVGKEGAEDTQAMLRAIWRLFLPNKVVLFRPAEPAMPEIGRLAGFTKDLKSLDGKATAYVCRNYQCELPTTEVTQMLELLQGLDRER